MNLTRRYTLGSALALLLAFTANAQIAPSPSRAEEKVQLAV